MPSAGLKSVALLLADMREASRRLSQSLFDVYETDWVGEEDLGAIVEVSDRVLNNNTCKTRHFILIQRKEAGKTIYCHRKETLLPLFMNN